jgi:hypothetical protein
MKIKNKDILVFVKCGTVSEEDKAALRALPNVTLVMYRDECPVCVTRECILDYSKVE